MSATKIKPALVVILLAGCALYSDVSIAPLTFSPAGIDRGADVQSMVKKADYLRAIELTSSIESRPRKAVAELQALGEAELTAGRYDAARQHLRSALDLEPFRTTYSQIAWDLSQVEYLSNNYGPSLEWAREAANSGLTIRQWHIDYLTALSSTDVYRFSGPGTDEVPMRVGRPDVPRIEVKVNKERNVSAVIDSGAVLSIISDRLADALKVKRLGTFEGTFYGLLGEPIAVHFGLLSSLEIGAITVENVPVAIMPDAKMSFLISEQKPFDIDFLLGANLLKEFRLELDFRRERIGFTRLLPSDRVGDPHQNLFMEGFRPMVRGTVNRKGWFLFVLDTGSEVTFLNESQLSTLPIQFYTPRVHGALLQGLGGAKKRGEKIENVELGLDKWAGTFKTLPMYMSGHDETAVGIVGENFLKNFKVVIDFGKMRLDLAKS